MAENVEKVVYICTHAGEDPERATLPFVLGNAALAMDLEAVVVLQGTGVYLAKQGYVDNVFAGGLPALKDQLKTFLELGGKLMVCVPCIKERRIEEADLVPGSEPVAAAKLTLELLSAKVSLVY